jgi:hypothetical protein
LVSSLDGGGRGDDGFGCIFLGPKHQFRRSAIAPRQLKVPKEKRKEENVFII